MTAEAESAKRSAHLEMIDRLAESADFAAFIGQALDEFCAFNQGYSEVDPFHQGVRAAGAWMIKEIALTDKGRAMLSAAFDRHLTKNHQQKED